MKPDDIRRVVLEELSNIAPETDPAGIDPGTDLREALDIDFMDFLNFITALHKRLGRQSQRPITLNSSRSTMPSTISPPNFRLRPGEGALIARV